MVPGAGIYSKMATSSMVSFWEVALPTTDPVLNVPHSIATQVSKNLSSSALPVTMSKTAPGNNMGPKGWGN